MTGRIRSCITVISLATSAAFYGCGGTPTAPKTEPTTAPPAATTPAVTAGVKGNASISGVVKFDGEAPKMPVIQMGADPLCNAKHKDPIVSEALVLGADNTMANVFVSVTEGLPAATWPAPAEPVVLNQDGCQYKPHVFGIQAGQTLKIMNPDGTLHNVHAMSRVNAEFNMAMPKTRTEAEKVFDKPEAMFPIKCDVHPWMGGWVSVMAHPFFAVTGTDGAFTITGLPAGTYTIEAWHEKLGSQKASVTVAADGTATQDFQFKKP